MSRSTALVRRMAERRSHREFERALQAAPPSMQHELRVIAMRQQVGGL